MTSLLVGTLAAMTVHVLSLGYTLCNRAGLPCDWPPGERWVDVREPRHADCAGCLEVLELRCPAWWSCHVCGRWRPDALVGVVKRPFDWGSVQGEENVRYCRDVPSCFEGAVAKSFLPKAWREEGRAR